MADINTVSDLDQFLSKPLQKKQPKQQGLAAPPAEPKQAIPQIKSVQDLDSFLKQPIQKFDTAPVEKWRKAQGDTGPSLTRPPEQGMVDKIFGKLGDIPVAGNLTLRDAYRRFSESSLLAPELATDPRVKWEREHVKQPLNVVSALEG